MEGSNSDTQTPEAVPPIDFAGALMAAAKAIATGVSLAAFVTFFGSAITYLSMDAIGVPPVQGLSAVPTENLLIIGANFLAPVAAMAVFAVAIACVIDLRQTQADSGDAKPTSFTAGKRALDKQRLSLIFISLMAIEFIILLVNLLTGSTPVAFWAIMAIAGMLLFPFVAVSVLGTTKSYVAYGIAVFVAIGVLLGSMRAGDIKHDRVAEPVAIIQKTGAPIAGVLIAQSPDGTLVGIVTHASGRARLLSTSNVAAGDVLAMSYAKGIENGNDLSLRATQRNAIQQALDLCASGKTITIEKVEKPICSAKQVKDLNTQLRENRARAIAAAADEAKQQ